MRLHGREQSRGARGNEEPLPRSHRTRSVAPQAQQRARGAPRRQRVMSEPVRSEDEINRLHREKMERRQAARRKVLATKTEERGLLIVYTGAGKGKSTAAFGMVLRCLVRS